MNKKEEEEEEKEEDKKDSVSINAKSIRGIRVRAESTREISVIIYAEDIRGSGLVFTQRV